MGGRGSASGSTEVGSGGGFVFVPTTARAPASLTVIAKISPQEKKDLQTLKELGPSIQYTVANITSVNGNEVTTYVSKTTGSISKITHYADHPAGAFYSVTTGPNNGKSSKTLSEAKLIAVSYISRRSVAEVKSYIDAKKRLR